MKKRVHLSLAVSCLLAYAHAAEVRGRVFDAKTRQPIVGAVVYSPTSKKGTTTTGDGSFSFSSPISEDSLRFSYLGYETRYLKVEKLQEEVVRVPDISLTPAVVSLDEILIQAKAQSSHTQIDRQSYRVDDFKTAEGGSAVDLLSKLPAVSVESDGTVSVRGTSDFLVYLNGKPTQISPSVLLAQLPVSQIENVDIISVPGSRFDAQGKGGIVNITTKKTGQQGLTVSANGMLGGGPWNNHTDDLSHYKQNDNRYNAGVNVMYFKDKLSLYGGVSVNSRNVNGNRTGDARVRIEDGFYKHMVASGERPEWYKNAMANVGADYKLNAKSTLSAAYFLGRREEGRSAFYVYNNFYGDIAKNSVVGKDRHERWIYNPNTDNRLGVFQSGNVDYAYTFSKTSDLKLSALMEYSTLDRKLQNENLTFDPSNKTIGAHELGYRQTDGTPLTGYRFSADYNTQLQNGSKLSVGLQPQFVNIQGSFDYDTLNVVTQHYLPYSALENSIKLSRNIYAMYADWSGSFSKFKYMLGFRLEYLDQLVSGFSPGYFSIFDLNSPQTSYATRRLDPFYSLHLSWEPTETDRIILASSRRVNRPQLKNLAPFLYRRHLEVYEVGDPGLEPEYLLNGELTYSKRIRKHSVSLTAYMRSVANAVFRVNTVTNEVPAVYNIVKDEVLIRSYTNAGNSQSFGAELNADLDLGKYAKLYVGGSLYQYAVKGTIFGYTVDNSSLNWSAKSNLNISMSPALKLNLDFNYKSATVTAQGQNDMLYLSNVALDYSPKKLKGWSFSARLLDIFNSNVEGLDTQAFNSSGKEVFYQTTDYYRAGRIVELGAKYAININGKKEKKVDSTVFGKDQF